MSAFDPMPFREAAAATASRRVLRHKHGVPSPRSLFAVVLRGRGSEPLGDKRPRMLEHCLLAFLRQVLSLLWSEPKAPTKAGPG